MPMREKNNFSDIVDQARAWRHDFHAHPELGYLEYRTSTVVAELLESFGLAVVTGLGGTGVVATLARGSGPFIGLRADMDALPLQELGSPDYKSTNAGCMHACGHDGHTAILLATAKYLCGDTNFKGNVHFIFQPAEETGAGARKMIEDGLFEKFPMVAVYGLHNWPSLKEGLIAVNPGAMMASQDTFEICISGSGAHAAMPEKGIDPVMIAAQLISALQTITSRRISPLDSVVLSVTMVEAGSAYNVIPQTATIKGTVRCLDQTVREQVENMIRSMATSFPVAFGGTGSVIYREGYPVTKNDPACAARVRDVGVALGGADCVEWNGPASMASEDFAFMLQACPGAYFWLGANRDGNAMPLHHPHYDFNDQVIASGIQVFERLAKSYQS